MYRGDSVAGSSKSLAFARARPIDHTCATLNSGGCAPSIASLTIGRPAA